MVWFKLETESNYWTNIVCAECTDKYFDEYVNFQKVLLI